MEPPETRYAKVEDVHIAYQVLGQGPPDLVLVAGIFTNVDYQWDEPSYAAFLRRLGSFSRLILFDPRGTGLSDRAPALPTLEQQMDDVNAVLDAVGSDRAAFPRRSSCRNWPPAGRTTGTSGAGGLGSNDTPPPRGMLSPIIG